MTVDCDSQKWVILNRFLGRDSLHENVLIQSFASLFSKADGWVSDHFRIIIKTDDTKESIIRKVWIEVHSCEWLS